MCSSLRLKMLKAAINIWLLPGPWWCVDYQDITLTPCNISQELLDHCIFLWSSPYDGIILTEIKCDDTLQFSLQNMTTCGPVLPSILPVKGEPGKKECDAHDPQTLTLICIHRQPTLAGEKEIRQHWLGYLTGLVNLTPLHSKHPGYTWPTQVNVQDANL